MNVNGTQLFNATALDQNNTPVARINIFWTVSNSTVGNVSTFNAVTGTDGNVTATFTAESVGNATVNATNGSTNGSANVIVVTTQLGNISGTKFNDLNGNGTRDLDEPGLANWTIVLTKPDGSNETTITNSDGTYTFSNLTSGNYTVAEVLKPEWKQTFPTNGTYNVTIAGGENLTGIDFGNNLPVKPSVNVTIAVRMIEKESLIPGGSTNITVDISSNMSQALSLQEIMPAGWNLTRISDDADAFNLNRFDFPPTSKKSISIDYLLNCFVGGNTPTRQ